jgi:hypothetical protein
MLGTFQLPESKGFLKNAGKYKPPVVGFCGRQV